LSEYIKIIRSDKSNKVPLHKLPTWLTQNKALFLNLLNKYLSEWSLENVFRFEIKIVFGINMNDVYARWRIYRCVMSCVARYDPDWKIKGMLTYCTSCTCCNLMLHFELHIAEFWKWFNELKTMDVVHFVHNGIITYSCTTHNESLLDSLFNLNLYIIFAWLKQTVWISFMYRLNQTESAILM
jgi:hypothetical protein